MNEETLYELLSRSLDDPLSATEAVTLEEALADSPELRVVRDDLMRIKEVAADASVPEAPDLPAALQAKVSQTYGRRGQVISLRRVVRHPLALAAACLLCIGLGYFLAERGTTGPEQRADTSFDEIRTEVLQAQEAFHHAVAKMEVAAMDRIATMPPELAHHFAHNLNIIDQAIRDCENISDKYLDNHWNYAALAKAYQAKVDLLQLILESRTTAATTAFLGFPEGKSAVTVGRPVSNAVTCAITVPRANWHPSPYLRHNGRRH